MALFGMEVSLRAVLGRMGTEPGGPPTPHVPGRYKHVLLFYTVDITCDLGMGQEVVGSACQRNATERVTHSHTALHPQLLIVNHRYRIHVGYFPNQADSSAPLDQSYDELCILCSPN